MPRHDGRSPSELRPITLQRGFVRNSPGSVLYRAGGTTVLVTAHVSDKVPPFLEGKGVGWLTAEYAMLPGSTPSRKSRGPDGRATEIQRLIGRSLRAVTDLAGFGERQVKIDCDVIQADGGTRTAAITGSYVALALAFRYLQKIGAVTKLPLAGQVSAVSCGIAKGRPVLDLDYEEDSTAEADANFVFTSEGGIVEIQGTAEQKPFAEQDFLAMLALARKGCAELAALQRQVLGAD